MRSCFVVSVNHYCRYGLMERSRYYGTIAYLYLHNSVISSSSSRVCVLWSVLADTVRLSILLERSRYNGNKAYLYRSQLNDFITIIFITCLCVVVIAV